MSTKPQQGWTEAKIESLESKTDKIVDILDRLTRVEEQNQSTSKATGKNTSDIEQIKSKMWVVHIMGGIFILAASFFAKQSLEMIEAAKKSPQLTPEQIAEIIIKVNKESGK